jgi:L-rhamnonate dehydratase
VKIDRVRLFQLQGILELTEELWEERLIRPIDVYPEHRAEGANNTPKVGAGTYRIEAVFVQVETDEGVSGLGGPITVEQGQIIARQLTPLVIGEDPRATERIWDKLYRSQVHGRGGVAMMALRAGVPAVGRSDSDRAAGLRQRPRLFPRALARP